MSFTCNSPSPNPNKPHILIVGAGITGLTLAQSLKNHSIPFSIFERDPTVTARGRGWGLTIHWSLDSFISLLPEYIVKRFPEVYVDPEASAKGENGNFLFFDVRSGETRWKVPPAKRIRVSRERMRGLLLEGVDVQWSKNLISLTYPTPSTITAHFSDSTTSTGTLLIGCDGLHSRVRSHLLSPAPNIPPTAPELARNHQLPVRLLGVSVLYPTPLALKLRALDPFFFQGGDPYTDTFFWFSFLDTPSNNSRSGKEKDSYECQILVSWPYRRGYRGQEEELEVPKGNIERVRLMKALVQGWASPFLDAVDNIPEETEVKEIRLEDWIPRRGVWGNEGGKVTLVGDSGHAMTMFRGEGANHGITDVSVLLSKILPVLQASFTNPAPDRVTTEPSLKDAIDAYEEEMIQRTGPAVLTSRRACLDAHDYKRIDDSSPLVSRRVMVTSE